MNKILVTGGAGYIGSHAVRALVKAGHRVVVADNLSKGHMEAVDPGAVFVKLDLADVDGLRGLFRENDFNAVMHFAGSIEVGQSMKEPALYMRNNVMNGVNLLEAMREAGVKNIIFSSTAAVYGDPVLVRKHEDGYANEFGDPYRFPPNLKEDDSLNPGNFYGVTKLVFENLLKKYDEFWGIKSVSLRYFNAAGADGSGAIGEDHFPETHLIPRIMGTLLGKYDGLKVFGADYDTPDGTCIRDYVHVTDLVDAHLLGLNFLHKERKSAIFNLGYGYGFSVMDVIRKTEKVTGKKVTYTVVKRREGDPARLLADASKARGYLNWRPRFTRLDEIILSAWKWHSAHPGGYGK
jgi:UDP-glucose 4-epimerase